MNAFRISIAALVLSFLLGSFASSADEASRLDELRKKGTVGERYDGTLAAREGSADASVRVFVDSVNAKRREIYEARAKKEGVPASEVGKVYALEIVEKAPAGTWFLGQDGKWVEKK